MKKVFLLLLIAGLMAGPAYWVQAKFLTGSRVALLDLRQGPEGTWRTAVFNLAPDMAAVGLILHLQASSPLVEDGHIRVNRCLARLHRDDEAAKPLAFTLRASNPSDLRPAFNEHLLYLEQVRAGHYWLEIMPSMPADMTLDKLTLEVSRNLSEPDSRVVTTGLVLFVIGLLGVVLI